jgi:fluoride exporter
MIYLAIALGGALGASARFALGEWIRGALPTNALFPVGTFVVNVVGSFALGLILRWAQISGELSLEWRAFLVVGLCGGFTTFSTFSGETFSLLESGEYGRAVVYSLASVVTCVLAIAIGVVAARTLARP